MNSIYARAHRLLNLKDFSTYHPPEDCGEWTSLPPDERQYILRMLVQRPGDRGLSLPAELRWLKDVIFKTWNLQEDNGLAPWRDFVYVTVRHGLVTSELDDAWHVDGFSMRYPHRPEQNYICSNIFPTEVLNQAFDIPADFDPRRHNIHLFFQDNSDYSKASGLIANRIFLIDPYIVHRRTNVPVNAVRTFFRISFIPIEIDDDSCTPNPLLPSKRYSRDGVKEYRDKLIRYVRS